MKEEIKNLVIDITNTLGDAHHAYFMNKKDKGDKFLEVAKHQLELLTKLTN